MGKLSSGAEVIATAGRVYIVDRLRQIETLNEVPTHRADIIGLQGEASGELVLHRQIEGLGVRRLHLAIQPPGDGEAQIRPGWRGERVGDRGSEGPIAKRKGAPAGEARGIFIAISPGGVCHQSAQPIGTGLVE